MPNNGNRIKTATKALAAQSGDNEVKADPESAVVDMLANLMHFAQKRGLDFKKCLRTAESHFVAGGGSCRCPISSSS